MLTPAAEFMQSMQGRRRFDRLKAPSMSRGLSADRSSIELWPGDKRRPYTPFCVGQCHS
jgi:hypothetical protein